jgi:hypothetical protein
MNTIQEISSSLMLSSGRSHAYSEFEQAMKPFLSCQTRSDAEHGSLAGVDVLCMDDGLQPLTLDAHQLVMDPSHGIL